MVKSVLFSYLIGVAVGGTSAVLILKDHYKRVADEEIESVKEMARKKLDEFSIKANDILGGNVDGEGNSDNRSNDNTECDELTEEAEGAGRVNYSTKFKGKGEVDDILNTLAEQEYPEEDTEKRKKNKGKRTGCKIIKVDDYDGYPQYRKLTVYYYVGDGKIADEYDEEIFRGTDDKELGKYSDYIDIKVLDKFGFIGDDDQATIFIRNEDTMTDFEVIKDFGAFAELKREE